MSKPKRAFEGVTPEPTRQKVNQESISSESAIVDKDLLFGKKNYILMAGGFGLILLGFLLMSGGKMPSSDVWQDDLIYSSRRTVLAPAVIIAGLVMQVVAIFKKKD